MLPWAEPLHCDHSVAHLLHAGIHSQLGWNCATHTAHFGEPLSPTLHRLLGLRVLCNKKTEVWRWIHSPDTHELWLWHLLVCVSESKRHCCWSVFCSRIQHYRRVQRSGAPQQWGHGRPYVWTLTGHVAGTSLPQFCYVLSWMLGDTAKRSSLRSVESSPRGGLWEWESPEEGLGHVEL